MAIIEWKKDGTVAIMTLNNGENRHNLTFARTMQSILDEIETDKEVTALVVASSDQKNWSQGIDLPWMFECLQAKDLESVKAFIYGMNDIFKRILLYPVPVIAAINGHAVANGAILSLACDFRLMRSDRGFFFFPEVDINIPFLPGMLAFMRKAVPPYKLEEMIFTGTRYNATDLETHHIIYKACKNEEALWEESMTLAGSFNKGRMIFGEMKKRLHKEIIDILEKEDPPYIEATSFTT